MASPEYGLPTSENYFADTHDCGDANFCEAKVLESISVEKVL